jgi:hypothetical protein
MSILAEHLFNPEARERLKEDLRLLTAKGVEEFAIHLSTGGKSPDKIQYSKRDVEALVALTRATEKLAASRRGECICPTCGLRHGGSNVDGGF